MRSMFVFLPKIRAPGKTSAQIAMIHAMKQMMIARPMMLTGQVALEVYAKAESAIYPVLRRQKFATV
jgi:hypothetical protein